MRGDPTESAAACGIRSSRQTRQQKQGKPARKEKCPRKAAPSTQDALEKERCRHRRKRQNSIRSPGFRRRRRSRSVRSGLEDYFSCAGYSVEFASKARKPGGSARKGKRPALH